jgi:hypothetical protein
LCSERLLKNEVEMRRRRRRRRRRQRRRLRLKEAIFGFLKRGDNRRS